MRGGLDDALDKLARRDELRRRAAGEATGTSPAVTELVEAIAGVVARHPELGVTVGAEGSGEPVLLHFFFAEGQVQVTADNPVQAEAPVARHADVVDVELVEPEPYSAPPASPAADPRRFSHDDQDRYGPPAYGYAERPYYADSDTAERRYGSFDNAPADSQYAPGPGETSRDLGARMRDQGVASQGPAQDYPPHPFAATPPPPVPHQAPRSPIPPDAQATHRIQAEHYRVPAEAAPTERLTPQRGDSMPSPLPKPIPLKVERPEDTEMAARRLAALLRDDPSLLNNGQQG
ncbi:hypothetical protein ODJ79_01110 [Actinoplanes sp. KI2]|uniref:hypothetical protein n=1 Tax=Actinoplanes sp. KI2 TaxID=2983315 RepID=UPI0021D5FC11|nr:hypothetical protein [Actinoplanes sp. KI2]MCU7722307.1 hypothetical protein [Actinoplanes sp. KI2]